MSRRLRLFVGIAVSAVCVWYAMREVRPAEVWQALRTARYTGFLAAMALTLFGFWVRAFRWRWLLTAPRAIGLDSLYSATMIGFMANNLFPLRLGEFVRAWALGRREQLSKTTVFATVVVERVVDMITLLAIFGLALLVHPISSETEAGRLANAGAVILLSTCVVLTAVLVIVERNAALMERLLGAIGRLLPGGLGQRVVRLFQHFAEGLTLFRDVPRLIWIFVLSFAMFFTFALCLQVSMWAIHIDVPWYAGIVMLVITAIGIMVPAAPGYIGTLNLACVAGLALFDVGRDQAVPFSWFYWFAQWVPVTVVGLWYLKREGLTLRSIGEVGGKEAEAAER